MKNVTGIITITMALTLGACGQMRSDQATVSLQSPAFGSASVAALMEIDPSFNELSMCFKRLRLKTVEDIEDSNTAADGEDNIDIALGEVSLSATGESVLGNVVVPTGDYRRIEVDLEDTCGTGHSLLLDKDSVFESAERITIKFEGDFSITQDTEALNLAFDKIVEQLSVVTVEADLKEAAEAISGDLWN